MKPKRIELPKETVKRVVRANCCLQPKSPEKSEIMQLAVGDPAEYLLNPKSKVLRVRRKFFSTNFLQNVTEDFMVI